MPLRLSETLRKKFSGDQPFSTQSAEAAAQFYGLGQRPSAFRDAALDLISGFNETRRAELEKQGERSRQFGIVGEKLTRPDVQAAYQSLPESERAQYKQGAEDRLLNVAGTLGGIENTAAKAAAKAPSLFAKAAEKLRKITDPFTENAKVLRRISPELADAVKSTYANAEVQAGKAFNAVVRPLKKLTKEEQENFIQHVQGLAPAMNEKVQQLATSYNKYRTDVAGKAEPLKLFPFGPRANYYPKVVRESYFENPKNIEKAVKHLVDTGQAADEGKARVVVENMRKSLDGSVLSYTNQDGRLLRHQGNLEISRESELPADAYESDPVVTLTNYFSQAYRRINETAHFGKEGERLPEYLNKVIERGGDARKAEAIIRDILSPREGAFRAITEPLTQVTSARKLTTSFISNAAQPTNTITTKGLQSTLQSLIRMLKDPEEALSTAERAGALNDDLVREATASKYKNWVSKLPWIKAFGNVENFNRILDANASEFAVRSIVNGTLKGNKTSARLLEKIYGIKAENLVAKGGLEGDDLLRAINESVNKTQFRVRAQDLPSVLNNPDFKLFTQLKSFIYKQSQFLMDQVVDEARQGNVAPLIRYLVAGTVLGEGVQDAKSLVRNIYNMARGNETESRPTGLKRVIENVTAVGGAGIIGDAVTKINKGKTPLYEWVFGPSVSDILGTAADTSDAITGDATNLGRRFLREIPYVGYGIAEEAFPPERSGPTPNTRVTPQLQFRSQTQSTRRSQKRFRSQER